MTVLAPPSADSSVDMTLSRDLGAAKQAYLAGDGEASSYAHHHGDSTQTEDHLGEMGNHVKSITFGGLDGIVTTFAVIASSIGASLSVSVIVILGFANLFADGISMGLGDALSEKAELDFIRAEEAREKWECDNDLSGEQKEMIEIYTKRGLSQEDAETVIGIISKNTDLFVDLMMIQELGLMPPDSADSPWVKGAYTFASFVLFGFLPLCPFVIALAVDPKITVSVELIAPSIAVTAVSLFLLGALKSRFTHYSAYKSGFIMLFSGGLAAIAAYLIGVILAIPLQHV